MSIDAVYFDTLAEVKEEAGQTEPEHDIEDPIQEDRCCICTHPIVPELAVPEYRPTGDNGRRMECWVYCSACWSEMVRLRQMEFDLTGLVTQTEPRHLWASLLALNWSAIEESALGDGM